MRFKSILEKKLTPGILGLGFILFQSCPAGAQEFWYIPHSDEANTPRELKLQSSELALPGFGISSTRAQLIKRFEYALEHKWLTAAQVQQFCNELKSISDKENNHRDPDGKLSFESRSSLAKQLSALNDRFEEMVLVREQSSPGQEGLQARKAMMLQRLNQAVTNGKLSNKKAFELKKEIAQATEALAGEDFSEADAKKVSISLSQLNTEIDKNMKSPSMTASKVVPFSR